MTSPTPPARRRNPRGSGHELRSEILAAARELIVENGHDSALTMRGIARRVGIAAQSIYLHFSEPDEIVQALTVDTFAELGRFIATATDGIDAPRDRLIAGCRAYMEFGVANPALYGLLFRRNRLLRGEEAQPEQGADDRDPDAGPFAYLIDGVNRCVVDGSAHVSSPLSAAVQLWAAMHGLVMLRGNDYQFPWPDLGQLETELITSIAGLKAPSRG